METLASKLRQRIFATENRASDLTNSVGVSHRNRAAADAYKDALNLLEKYNYPTVEYPKVAGYYWYKYNGGSEWEWKITEVRSLGGIELVIDINGNSHFNLSGLAGLYLFRGPLTPPG